MSNALPGDPSLIEELFAHPSGILSNFMWTPKLKRLVDEPLKRLWDEQERLRNEPLERLVNDCTLTSFCTPLPPILYDVKPPEPPTSEDYAEFRELLKSHYWDDDDETINLLFRELFTLDSEGHIIGVTDNLTNPNLKSLIRDDREDMILEVLQCVGLYDEGPAYPKLEPWIEATREALRTPRKHREDDPGYSRYGMAMIYLCETYTKGHNYKMAYPEVLVRAAIESNFDDSDPRKARLLRCTPHGRSSERTDMLKWCDRDRRDYRKEFTSESLAGMKPALLAYLEDLEDLKEMWTPTLERLVNTVTTFCTPLPPILYDLKPPGAEPPTSEDYAEFRKLVEAYRDVESMGYEFINLLFRELFTTDSEGHIIGVTDNMTNPNIKSAIRDNFKRRILKALQCVGLYDKGRAYPKLEPWIEATCEALRTPRKQREDDPAYSRYYRAMVLLCQTYTKGHYQMAYPEVLVRAAIESNFDDSDPRKARLLRCTPHGRSPELTEMSKWYRRKSLDYREEFTDESLAGMKPALLAYLEDLEDLTDEGSTLLN